MLKAPLLEVLFPVTTSLLLEIYISIRLKKLPWLSLKSVTMGHLLMALAVFVIVNNQQNNVQFKSIQVALILLGFQLLYTLKYRYFFIECVRKMCCVSNSVVPRQLDLELNDIGIFVGPQRSVEMNKMDNEEERNVIKPKSDLTTVSIAKPDNSKDDKYGGVYMGSPKRPVKENKIEDKK